MSNDAEARAPALASAVAIALLLGSAVPAIADVPDEAPSRALVDVGDELSAGESGAKAGFSVQAAGDVNADGIDDVLVGAPHAEHGNGAAYLVHGPVTDGLSLDEADAALVGENLFDKAGYAVAPAGDVNADGYDDVLVGARGNTHTAPGAGAAYLVHGPIDGRTSLGDADAIFYGEQSFDRAGTTVASAGDVNGDGHADVMIGAPYADEGGAKAGTTYLYYGPVTGTHDLGNADARILGQNTDDWAGGAVDSAGDVDGDGLDDILIGATYRDDGGQWAGAAYLVTETIDGRYSLDDAQAKLVGEAAFDYAGESVAGVGDTNGDGYDDLLVGTSFNDHNNVTNTGAAYLVTGPITGTHELVERAVKLYGEDRKDKTAKSVAAAGDVNADGYTDVLVGSPREDAGGHNAGAAYLVHGPITEDRNLSQADLKLEGSSEDELAGRAVAGAGDVTGDGVDDLLVGAPKYDPADDRNAGAGFLVAGEEIDRDVDALPDVRELEHGTDPLDPDTDGDAFADGTETACGSNPTDPTSVPTPTGSTPALGLPMDQLAPDVVDPVPPEHGSTTCSEEAEP